MFFPDSKDLVTSLFQKHGWTTVLFEEMLPYFHYSAINYDISPFDIDYSSAHHYLNGYGIGGDFNHNNPINLIGDYHLAYTDLPLFMHIHLDEVTHDDINMAKNYDYDLANMLQNLSASKALKETFFLVLGDHGNRKEFSTTEQGMIEDNMAALLLIPPTSLAEEHPEWLTSLRSNSEVLTSHWDVHQLLRQVVALAVGEEEVEAVYHGLEGPGGSLLQTLGNRSCTDAGVTVDFCSCPASQVALDPVEVEDLVKAVLADTNAFLEPLWGCQILELVNITEATMVAEQGNLLVTALLEVTPQPARFLLHIRQSNSSSSLSVSMTRKDRYSLTSWCVPPSERLAKQLCVCQSSHLPTTPTDETEETEETAETEETEETAEKEETTETEETEENDASSESGLLDWILVNK